MRTVLDQLGIADDRFWLVLPFAHGAALVNLVSNPTFAAVKSEVRQADKEAICCVSPNGSNTRAFS